MNDLHSWNASNILLKNQNMLLGWQLFDHGLRTPAKGSQKWQRALPKPFTSAQIPLWRGEDLSGKSIFLLEEQAIGDVMQFLSLVPKMIEEAGHVSILITNRLYSIYLRSFKKYIHDKKMTVFFF